MDVKVEIPCECEGNRLRACWAPRARFGQQRGCHFVYGMRAVAAAWCACGESSVRVARAAWCACGESCVRAARQRGVLVARGVCVRRDQRSARAG